MSRVYSPLEEDKSDIEDSQPGDDYESFLAQTASRRNSPRRTVLLLALFIPVSCMSLIGLGAWIGSRWLANPDIFCPRHVQHYSQILKDVDTSLHTVRFNGSLLKENAFRKEAGEEVDAAWESIGVGYRPLSVPESEALETGFRLDQVKINKKYGGGFPANVEGLHHLHCLNLVRQALWYNYDYYHAKGEGAFKNDDNIVRYHVSHCLDIVRQQLMCQPDTGMLGQVWWNPEAPTSFVDFNTEHKCKNFDAIRQWAKERQLPNTVNPDFLEPPKKGDLIYETIP